MQQMKPTLRRNFPRYTIVNKTNVCLVGRNLRMKKEEVSDSV